MITPILDVQDEFWEKTIYLPIKLYFMIFKQHYLLLTATLFVFWGCSTLELDEPPQAEVNLKPITLENGITPLLNQDQINRFEASELKALDKLVMQAQKPSLKSNHANQVLIPAGSENALNDALAELEEGGTIIFESGEHLETETVFISKSVKIVGEEGAIIRDQSAPSTLVGFVQAVFHVQNASDVTISNLSIQATNAIGGTAIILENSPNAKILGNEIIGHEAGIINEQSDRVRILYNRVTTTQGWLTGEVGFVIGILNMNGKSARILANEVSSSFIGIFLSDEQGLAIANETYENAIGLMQCTAGGLVFPDGTVRNAALSCKNWLTIYNSSHDNFDIGFLVIDGANANNLYFNKAANNANYDIELAGESLRFGFVTPTSFENKLVTYPNQKIKDCGNDNEVIGVDLVNNSEEPCS